MNISGRSVEDQWKISELQGIQLLTFQNSSVSKQSWRFSNFQPMATACHRWPSPHCGGWTWSTVHSIACSWLSMDGPWMIKHASTISWHQKWMIHSWFVVEQPFWKTWVNQPTMPNISENKTCSKQATRLVAHDELWRMMLVPWPVPSRVPCEYAPLGAWISLRPHLAAERDPGTESCRCHACHGLENGSSWGI